MDGKRERVRNLSIIGRKESSYNGDSLEGGGLGGKGWVEEFVSMNTDKQNVGN